MLVTGSACAGEGRSDVTRQVQILAFDGMEVLDDAGPYEVFNVAEQTSPAAFTVQTVGVSPRPVGRGGFEVVPVCPYSQAPPADILVIPGGRGTRPLMRDQALLAWIAGRAAGAELVMTVCTGALLAAAAGLLDGLAATTHHGAFGELERAAPTATVVRSVRFGAGPRPGSTPRRVSPQALTSRCTSWRSLQASKHGQPPSRDGMDVGPRPGAAELGLMARHARSARPSKDVDRLLPTSAAHGCLACEVRRCVTTGAGWQIGLWEPLVGSQQSPTSGHAEPVQAFDLAA